MLNTEHSSHEQNLITSNLSESTIQSLEKTPQDVRFGG